MSTNQKEKLRVLMKKYLDRSCTEQERNELIDQIRLTSTSHEMDELWQEVWKETGDNVRYEELSWNQLLQLESQRERAESTNLRHRIFRWSAAAAVLVGLLLLVRWWTQGEDLMIFETGFGENIEFVLDDGTRINLNANSKLVWNNNWEKDGIRSVDLDGEAYFDVAHIDLEGRSNSDDNTESGLALPFEVTTSDLTIRVLGTSFNAIQRRGKTEVFLEEGLVELALHRRELEEKKGPTDIKVAPEEDRRDQVENDQNLSETNVVRMLPGEWVSYSAVRNELLQKSVGKIDPLTEWKDGTLSYQDVEFRFMLQNLEDIYGLEFSVDDSTLLSRRVNIGVPFEDWETVKDMMGWMLDIEVIEMSDKQVRIEKRKEN